MSIKIKNKIIFILALFIVFPMITFAVPMSSENYSVPSSVIGSGVVSNQSSANYSVQYTPGKRLIYDAPTTETTEETTTVTTGGGGGGISGGAGGVGSGVSHIKSFNFPLTISSTQSGTLTQNLTGEKKIILDVPKEIISSGKITFVITPESALGEVVSASDTSIIAVLTKDMIFDVTAKDQNGNTVTSFPEFITITLIIPRLPEDTGDLGVYFFDETIGRWILIPNAVFSDGKVTFKVNHLTRFAVFSVNKATGELIEKTGQVCDIVVDYKIDILDFNALMVQWGLSGFGNSADCNGDQIVNIFDFNLLMVSWSS